MGERVVFGVVAVCEGVSVGVVAVSVLCGSDLEGLCAYGASVSKVHLECCLGSACGGLYPGEKVL